MALPLILFALLSGQDAVPTVEAPAAEPAAAVSGQAEYTPEGAPADDYQFTAWCRGVLEGHMALAERIQPVLPLDEVQQKVGAAYLRGYDEALEAGKGAQSAENLQAAANSRLAARSNWEKAMNADLQLAADTYLAWQLPGRCEHAAKRVAGRDDIFRLDEQMDLSAPLAASSGPAALPLTEPAPTPETATSTDMGMGNLVPGVEPMPMPMDAEPAVEPAATVAAATEAPAAEAVAAPVVQAAAEPAEAPATEDGKKVVSMPKKGRLLPFGKRE